MALSALYSQRVRSNLPKACHSILHSLTTSIKEEKKNTLLLQVLSFPHYFLSLLDFLPPIISLFQICNLLFIFFLCVCVCLVGRGSVHLIKMYISKSFFKGGLFAERTTAKPRATGNYRQTEQSQIACFHSAPSVSAGRYCATLLHIQGPKCIPKYTSSRLLLNDYILSVRRF